MPHRGGVKVIEKCTTHSAGESHSTSNTGRPRSQEARPLSDGCTTDCLQAAAVPLRLSTYTGTPCFGWIAIPKRSASGSSDTSLKVKSR